MKKVFFTAIVLFLLGCEKNSESDTGALALNFQLKYEGQPLVMFDRYEYPNGMEVFFTRFSFYLSNLTISKDDKTVELTEIEDLNLTPDHETLAAAQKGITLLLDKVAIGDYEQLEFGIGVPPDLNARQPRDFPNDHPLANSGEYWTGWQSYIFSKTEGKMDTDGDGQAELGLAYHIGADETYRIRKMNKSFSIQKGETTTLTIEIELTRMFDNGTTIYDPLETAQIHSLSQLPEAIKLADNLVEAFN